MYFLCHVKNKSFIALLISGAWIAALVFVAEEKPPYQLVSVTIFCAMSFLLSKFILRVFYKITKCSRLKGGTWVITEAGGRNRGSEFATSFPPSGNSSSSGATGSYCDHNWRFKYKGADKKYPRGIYECTKCGTTGFEENFGDGNIRER